MINILDLIIISLAAWRITSILVREEGPYDICEKFRYMLGVRYDEHSKRVTNGNMLASLVLCTWCTSVWVAALFFILYYISNNIAILIAAPLAISTLTIFTDIIITGVSDGK